MSCRSGCPTRDHGSWGECARASGIQLGDVKGEGTKARLDRRFSSYDSARRQGIQPATTRPRDIDMAVKISERTGRAFDAAAV